MTETDTNARTIHADTDTALAPLFASQPLLWEKLRRFNATLRHGDSHQQRLQELCRLRIAAIHACDAEWQVQTPGTSVSGSERQALMRGEPEGFAPHERAALALAEKLPFDHHGITDSEVQAVRAVIGDAGTVALMTAMAFADVRCRWLVTMSAAFPSPSANN